MAASRRDRGVARKTQVSVVLTTSVYREPGQPRRSNRKGRTAAAACGCRGRPAAALWVLGGGGGGRRGCSCGSSAGTPRGLLMTEAALLSSCIAGWVGMPSPGYTALMSGWLSAASSAAG